MTTELEEARELLRQAERVRESQIALEAERDRAVAELEQLQVIATEAQTEAEERTRLLAEEQDRHQAERETLLNQRTVLEQELGSSIEQLAAAAAVADEREAQIQVDSERLLEALDAIRALAAELVSGSEEISDEPETVEAEPETTAESESDEVESERREEGLNPARTSPTARRRRSNTRCSSPARTATSSSRRRAYRRGRDRRSSSSFPIGKSPPSSRSCAAVALSPAATSASISRRFRGFRA